jgi:hypothetical protein
MKIVLGHVSLAAALVLGVTSASLARETAPKASGAGKAAAGLHGIGFTEPKFKSSLRTGKDQPYTWPVSDRYRPVSQPYYGHAY